MPLRFTALAAALAITPVNAGGLGNVMINAGEIRQGMESSETRRIDLERQRLELERQRLELERMRAGYAPAPAPARAPAPAPQRQDKIVNVQCGPMFGTKDMPERNCTRIFESGRIETVHCKMDGAGTPYCYPL